MAGVKVGLKNLVYALELQDDENGVAYDIIKPVKGAITAKITPKTDVGVLYSDDSAGDVDTAVGETDVEFGVKDLPLPVQADWLGHSLANGILVKNVSDYPPNIAIGFMSRKSNGKYRYVWLYKGKFSVPAEDYETKADKVKFQPQTIKGTFLKRNFDGNYQATGDDDEPGFAKGATWFNAVQDQGPADTTPPTVAANPANGASAVADNSTVVWTFDEAIQSACVIPANFMVQKADGSAQVAGTLTLDATAKIVTFQPTANFDAITEYMAIATVGVKDLAGNAMAAPSVAMFTTA